MKQQFDLYKWIIIGSLVAMPVAGGWLYWLSERIAEGERAIAAATRPRTGELQTIGRLGAEILNQAKSAGTASGEDPARYFDDKINRASEGTLSANDYNITPAQVMPHRETKSLYRPFRIEFKRDGKPYALTRELVQAILFMIESRSPAWRLRSLHLTNETTRSKQMQVSGAKPPPEIEDHWFVELMEFARREPDTSATRRGR